MVTPRSTLATGRGAVFSFASIALLCTSCSIIEPTSAPEKMLTIEVRERPSADGPRILCVVAHPDDEIAFAGVLYKTSTHLGGICDLFVLTNGEGGFKYSTLAEEIYDLELTEEAIGRAHLPAIRRAELTAGCRWLGMRRIYWLGEQDLRYTQDVDEVLGPNADVWNIQRIKDELQHLLVQESYDLVLTMAPTAETHGHHKAATLLAVECVAALAGKQPAVLCVRGVEEGAAPPAPLEPLPGRPLSRLMQGGTPFVFDRLQSFGYRNKLDYRIVANWAIAEHKSQGTMQLLMGRGAQEFYYAFACNSAAALERASAIFQALGASQFESKSYGPTAGTTVRR